MADSELSAEQQTKLAHFQEITHVDSLDECRQILEVFEWNLESALQSTFGDSNPITTTTTGSSSRSNANTTNPLENRNENLDLPRTSRENNAPVRRVNSFNNQQQLPNVNVFTQRTLSYHAPQQQALVPKGFFQWSIFIISFPFKLIFSSLLELASFFWSLFESDPLPIDYDPLANVAEFAVDYNQKYGTLHPDFYQGSYAQAVNEAKRDLKFLLVYLHQNDHKDSNTFATETLCHPDIVEFVRHTFVIWACSKHLPEGRKVFNALKAKRCPFLGIIVLRHSRMTLVSKIEGPIGAAELLLQLANLVAENEPELVTIRMDRREREQTQLLRQQQDQAYEESLQADREKAKKKQEIELETRRQLELEKQKIEEEEQRQNNILNRKTELRKYWSETQQPDASNPLSIKLVFKLPTGTRIERVFLKSDPLSSLYKFVFCHEECPHSFNIVKNFPRKVIECDEKTDTSIVDYGINEPMLLFVNDLDA